ncbi:TonB-dependent receptor [Candidatus Palauibacter sp.]|uniref:TonB-dependent receptor n=1 Tax=Candidatus Palauibacter sp. TaxID=3101350 RepID=UPI003B5BA600
MRPPRIPVTRRWSAGPLAVLLLLSAGAAEAAAQAQATTGVIRGLVRDPLGAPVAGAAVLIEHRATGLATTVETTSNGTFVRTLLPLGVYDVTARALGQFGDERVEGLVLRVGEMLDLVLDFKPVAVAEITVTAERAPLVDTEDASSSHRLAEEVVDNLPNNGRNFLDYTLLTPGVSVSQGPDGEVLNIGGQRGIFNNVSVDGADFNNPFFGEQRGGQRPAFTFNQDAIEEIVVVNQGASAEFGRSAGGFVNVITKSGTNDFTGSAHYFGQWDAISSAYPSERGGGEPDFGRGQFGFTFGGPIVRDKAFFFVAYDQQEASETKQFTRNVVNRSELEKLETFLQTQWPGLFDEEFGPIQRTDDNKALVAKLDFNLSDRHQASFKYNYTWSQQVNGTFDVDSWGLSANGLEEDFSHAVNASLRSQLSNTVSHEFRFQYAREDRPRGYSGPLIPGAAAPPQPAFAALGGRPFPDIAMDFADGFRIGLPFFLPIDPGYDTRVQLVDNLSFLAGDHLFKVGLEYNRTSVGQQFIGFANGLYKFASVDGFMNFVTQGNRYVTCSDGSDSATGVCPAGTTITGPVLLYLQALTLGDTPQNQLGLQDFPMDELGLFIQDTWRPRNNLSLNLGLRWEGSWHPDMFIDPEDTFYGPWIGQSGFPSDGRIPDDLDNFQPRFGLAWDPRDDGRTLVRLNAGSYFSRIPMLVFAQHRTTNGAFQGTQFAASDATFLPPPPRIGEFLTPPPPGTPPFQPGVNVANRDLELPRTWSFNVALEQAFSEDMAATVSLQHARTDNLFRFVDRNAAELGAPFAEGANGLGTLTVTESSARSRYNAITLGLHGDNALSGRLSFEANYTLAFDRSDDDNERDPFNFFYASATDLTPEYNWSIRDRRHQMTGFFLFHLRRGVLLNHVFRYLSASPMSESCGPTAANPLAAPAGERAGAPADRVCADGSILRRNTLRRENDFFTWDLRISKVFPLGGGRTIEPILEVFNLTGADNFLDTAQTGLLFNFDGTIRSGLGDTRRAQLGVRFRF